MYKLYFIIKRIKQKKDLPILVKNILDKLLGYIEAYYNLCVVKRYRKHPTSRDGITKEKRKQKIIVSLTSYPKRI